jgi:hypothetical protein
MTLEQIAALVKAERRGRNYVALCPAHREKTPSLSLKAGFDGRVLIKCFAGCPTEAVLSAMGLQFKDLFPGPIDPQEVARLRAKHAANEARRLALAAEHARACDNLDRLQTVVSTLGARMAQGPEGDALAASFHEACDLLHGAQRSLDVLQTKF